MARMLGISDATVHRRLKDFNHQISNSFSTVDDNTLDGFVCSIKEEFPNSGYRMVCGHLKCPCDKKNHFLFSFRF